MGWDISRHESCTFTKEELQEIRNIGTPLARFAVDILSGLRRFLEENVGTENVDLPDPIAMAIALDRELATGWTKHFVQVDDSTGPSRGSTIVDQ